jgi:hypothetical protein
MSEESIKDICIAVVGIVAIIGYFVAMIRINKNDK